MEKIDGLNEKIKKLIQNSLFLGNIRKSKILRLLKNADDNVKKALVLIFESEKDFFTQAILGFIKKNNGMAELDRIFTDSERTIRVGQENEHKGKDDDAAEKLLDKI